MRHASGHDYRNNSFIVDVAMVQIPRSTERISSLKVSFYIKHYPHIHRHDTLELVFLYCVQCAHRISFNATTVSALRHQSTVTSEWTALMDQMNADVVSSIYYTLYLTSLNNSDNNTTFR